MGIPVHEWRGRVGEYSELHELRGRCGDFVKYFSTEGVISRGGFSILILEDG